MTDRRDFIRRLALGAAGFWILPSAETYERIWRPTQVGLVHPWGCGWIPMPPELWDVGMYTPVSLNLDVKMLCDVVRLFRGSQDILKDPVRRQALKTRQMVERFWES